MMRRWLVGGLVLLMLAGGLVYVFNYTTLSTWVYGMGRGWPAYAHRWADAFRDIPDPEAAQARYPEVTARRFENGEWAFGICSDSHSSHRGGTIMVKDSTGQVRAFFGHVCGEYFLESALRMAKSLDDFYGSEAMRNFGLREYQLP
jgi:hypothetical protein